MTIVGQQLVSPESGWKRIDDRDGRFIYDPSWLSGGTSSKYAGTNKYTNAQNAQIKFKITSSSSLRIITRTSPDQSSNISIKINGIEEFFSASSSNTFDQALVYEKTGLNPNTINEVIITNLMNNYFEWDAIDIDNTGRLLHPDEVVTIEDLTTGKRIRCHYETYIANTVGSFSGLGKETADFIPTTSTTTPNGDFYLISVTSKNNKTILIADRFLQHSISWDVLNTAGISSGSGVQPEIPISYTEDLCVDGTASAYRYWQTGLEPYKAFDNNNNTRFATYTNGGVQSGDWLKYDFGYGNEKHIRKITIQQFDAGHAVANMYIQNSKDGTNWITVQQIVAIRNGLKQEFNIVESSSARYWRILPNSNVGTSGNGWDVVEVEMMESLETENPTIRLLTGGVNSSDIDNEYNQYIVNYTGDNNVWNWNTAISTWTSTTTGTSTNRVVRGYSSIGNYGSNTTNTAATKGFRPVFEIDNRGNEDLSSSITIPFRQDISSLIYVYRDEYFDGSNNISQRKSYFGIPYRNDLPSSFTVAPNGFMTGNVVLTPLYWADVNTSMQVKNVTNIIGYIAVPPHNKMSGFVDIYPPPISTVDIFTQQDAFIRSDVPLLNYGVEQEMVVGIDPNTNEIFKSLFKFDISSIPPNQKIKNAKINLYYDKTSDVSSTIQMWEVAEQWVETGITWANAPPLRELTTSFDTPSETGYMQIDVQSIVNAWYTGARENNGWLLSSENSIDIHRFYTKERSTNRPYLSVDYYDPVAKSIGYLEFELVNLTVRQNKDKDILTTITVTSTYTEKDFPSYIHVLNKDMIESFIMVNKPNLPSLISVQRSKDIPIDSSLSVRRKWEYPFDSYLTVSRPFLISTISIRGSDSKSTTGILTVRRQDSDGGILGSMFVSRPFMPASIDVFIADLLNSAITIVRPESKDVLSTIQVRRDASKDVTGHIDVWGNSILQSKLFVISGYLASSITIPYRDSKDISGRLSVKEKYAKDLITVLGVYQFSSIDGSIQVVHNGGNVGFVIII